MKTFKQLIEETFDDPFAAHSNIERRERGEPDYEGESKHAHTIWYAYVIDQDDDKTKNWINHNGTITSKPEAFSNDERLHFLMKPGWIRVKWIPTSEYLKEITPVDSVL